jgi:transcription elongation factor SPT5
VNACGWLIHVPSKREVSAAQGGYAYQGDFFDKQGYLEKGMKLSSLQTDKVAPTLEEITRFSGGAVPGRADDLGLLPLANMAVSDSFHIGDNVIIISGELRNVTGCVKSIQNDIVTVIPDKHFGLMVSQRCAAYYSIIHVL